MTGHRSDDEPLTSKSKVATAPYGTWISPIAAANVAAASIRLGGIQLDGGDIYWLEARPSEGGRNVVVRRSADGQVSDATPAETNVRTRVHEYGGGAYCVSGGVVYYSEFADQRLYRMAARQQPEPLTPTGAWFYADSHCDTRRHRLICVREDHSNPGQEPKNTVVTVPLFGEPNAGEVIASGHDFYSTPRVSPDASRLSWLAWNHPNMPWNGTELWVGSLTEDGAIKESRQITDGADAIFQPGWAPDNTLYFVSDRTGWWNLYRLTDVGAEIVCEMNADFGRPQWQCGMSTWTFADENHLVVSYQERGRWRLGLIDVRNDVLTQVATDLEPGDNLAATSTHAVFVGASVTMMDTVVQVDLETGEVEAVRRASDIAVAKDFLSTPESIEFPTDGGNTAHAFMYAPRNPEFREPEGERPPLLVVTHGGPTSSTSTRLNLEVQYWTSRGFAVVDVNYRGSSGYGREYRRLLNGAWGVADVADCVRAAEYLVQQGRADADRIAIRGRSAGGYTTLAALTFRPEVFKAGASYYGISDLDAISRDTHKFESRYLDSLVGPRTSASHLYRKRSPIHFVDRLNCPLILFQGLDDRAVPPNQSEMMAAALRAKGLPVALLRFEGEQHGFRRRETIVTCLEAELYFYGAVFGFTPSDRLRPIAIDNLDSWRRDKARHLSSPR